MQLHATPLGSITVHQREEISICLSVPCCEEAVGCNKVTTQSPLLKAEQAK